MSIMHFLAANKEMPLGSFGEKRIKSATKDKKAIQLKNVELPEGYIPLEQVIDLSDIKEEEIEVYSTYEDAAGIYVEKVPTENENVKKTFSESFVYLVSANMGNLL
jgi:replication fork clamp-binding protein CrfC